MANKSVYVGPEDEVLWERAAKVAARSRQSLSGLVHVALAKYLGEQADLTTLTVQRGRPLRQEQFEGRWLVEADTEEDFAGSNDAEHEHYTADTPAPPESWRSWIGETVRGSIVVYSHHWAFDDGTTELFEVFESFDAARAKLGYDPRISAAAWDRAAHRLVSSPEPNAAWLDI